MDINDVTYAINGAVFEVNQVLGAGFLEKVHLLNRMPNHRSRPSASQGIGERAGSGEAGGSARH